MRISNKIKLNKNKIDIYSVESNVEKIRIEDREYSFEDALSFIGMGKMHYYLTFITGLIISSSMTETMGMSFIMKSAECDLNLESSDKGLLSSVGYAGIVLMAFIWGYLSDTKGRRDVMKWTLLCTSGASILSSFAPNFVTFIVLRFFVGVFLSASVGSAYPYVGEFTPISHRQMMMALASFSFGLSQIYVPAVAWLVFSLDFKISVFGLLYYRPWRLLIVLFALPGLISTVALFFLPESPKYHMAQGNICQAMQGLNWLYSKNTGKCSKDFPIKWLKSEKDDEVVSSLKEKTFFGSIVSQALPLLRPPYVKSLIISFLIVFLLFFTHASLGLWYMEIENNVAESKTEGTLCRVLSYNGTISTSDMKPIIEEICDETISSNVYVPTFILGIFYTLTFVLITVLLKFMGRGWISCFCLFASGICGLLLFWITNPLVTLIVFTTFLSIGGPVVSVVTGTAVILFPTNYRAMAVCMILTLGRVGTVFGTNFIGSFLDGNCEMTIGVLVGVVFGAGFLNFFLPLR